MIKELNITFAANIDNTINQIHSNYEIISRDILNGTDLLEKSIFNSVEDLKATIS